MIAKTRVTGVFFVLGLVLASGAAHAGSFKVAPIKLFYDAKAKSAVLRVHNTDREKATLQLEAFKWTNSEDEQDQYTPTSDIVFFPKILVLEKDEEKIVRVGYRGEPEKNERTYRLYLEELPVSKSGETAIKTVLRLGVPIFIAPIAPQRIGWVDKIELRAGVLGVTVKNIGNQHLLVTKLKASAVNSADTETFAKEVGGWYVLPGVARTFYIDFPKEACEKSKTVKLTIQVEQHANLTAESELDPAQCRAEMQRGKEPEKSRAKPST